MILYALHMSYHGLSTGIICDCQYEQMLDKASRQNLQYGTLGDIIVLYKVTVPNLAAIVLIDQWNRRVKIFRYISVISP